MQQHGVQGKMFGVSSFLELAKRAEEHVQGMVTPHLFEPSVSTIPARSMGSRS